MTALWGCGGHGGDGSSDGDAGSGTVPLTCTVTAPTSCPTPAPHYADVEPIIQQNCTAPCHAGVDPDGPWPLTTYEHVADWADIIRGDMLDCSMPPADAGVAITTDERQAILTWIRCGFPE